MSTLPGCSKEPLQSTTTSGAAAHQKTSIKSCPSSSTSINTSSSASSTSSSADNSINEHDESTTAKKAAAAAAAISSNADYDNIRNTTLLFFLDRLFIASKDGKEARTLHDLSCLFGTKDFTKEMRQIVGASRNGLKKFLELYPSLFTIEGDKVYLTQLKQDASKQTYARDYNQEAVDYFKQKLLQFGTSLVPIKNLFGYRSQASQEVRHVSGKNAREFRQFLRAHEDVFEILADEHVVLKSALREMESRGEKNSLAELHSSLLTSANNPEDNHITDPYLNKQFAHFIEDCLRKLTENNNNNNDISDHHRENFTPPAREVSIEYLYERIQCDCKNELFLKMIKSVEDLRMFLRMYPKLFKKYKKSCDQQQQQQQQEVGPTSLSLADTTKSESNDNDSSSSSVEYVRLLSSEEQRELEEAQAFASMSSFSRQHSTLGRSNTVESHLSNGSSSHHSSPGSNQNSLEPMSLPPIPSSHHQNATKRLLQDQHQTHSQQTHRRNNFNAPETAERHQQVSRSSSSSAAQQASSQHLQRPSSSLRANAPPFVPSTRSSANQQPIQRSHSNLTQSSRQQDYYQSHTRQPQARNAMQPIDQRSAIRNYLMKANNQANNNNNNNNNNLWPTPVSANHHQPQQQQQPLFNGDYLRARTVDIVREASNIITRIMNTTDAVAFDCKGYNLGFDGQITLIQFGFLPSEQDPSPGALMRGQQKENNNNNNNKPKQTVDGRIKPEVCVFDLITNPELAYCLKPLLESDKIVKIVHDVRNKSNALHVQFGITLKNVFDTQVANLVIQQQDTGKPAYKSRYISMSKLCEVYGDEELMKYRNLIKSKTRHNTGSSTIAAINDSGHSSLPITSATTTTSSSRAVKDVNYWRTRPLTKPMIFESTMDVYCLIGGIYQNLKSKLRPEYEPLFDQLNLEGVLARIKPDEIRSAKKERKIDLEVIDLKRKLYSDTKGSIVLSNREIRLLRHIDLTEEVRNKIQQCKKVAKKLERLDMKAAQMMQSLNSQQSGQDNNNDQQSMDGTNSSSGGGGNSMKSSQSLSAIEDSNVIGTTAFTSAGGDHDGHEEEEDDDDATGHMMMMTNLMESSIFDELKDKMIESSSLLESLEEDNDDITSATGEHGHLSVHSHNGSSHDCCRCQCHRNSTDGNGSDHNNSLNNVIGHNQSRPSLDNQQTPSMASKSSSSPPPSSDKPDKIETNNAMKLEDEEAVDKPITSDNNNITDNKESSTHQQPQQLDSVNSDSGSAKSSSVVDMAIQCDLLS